MAMIECKSADEVRENYLAVRRRVKQWKPRPKTVQIVEVLQATSIPIQYQEPEPPIVWRHPSVHRIVEAVCKRYLVSRTDLLSARRTLDLVRPRQIAMYLAKQLTLCSLVAIGQRLGGRDHTTVLHGVRKITTRRPTDEDLDAELKQLESILGPKGG